MPIRRDANSQGLARIEVLLAVIAETTADMHTFAARAEEASIRRRRAEAQLVRERRAQSQAKRGKKR